MDKRFLAFCECLNRNGWHYYKYAVIGNDTQFTCEEFKIRLVPYRKPWPTVKRELKNIDGLVIDSDSDVDEVKITIKNFK